MDCAQSNWLSDKEYLKAFNRKVTENRIPLSGSIELIQSCNLTCCHCYLGNRKNKEEKKDALTTDQWLSIIDKITEQGCLYLLLTGGEPLLVKDFKKIYTYAKTKGLLITLFTNGTLVTKSIVDLFKEYPPQDVEISLYGATAETYDRITGIKGSFTKCQQGIKMLLDHGIRLKLKTVLMTLNRHEFHDMENMAKTYGVKFRFDAAIFPCFNGDKSPLDLRVAPHEAIEKEFSDDDRSKQWQDYYPRMKGEIVQDTLYSCGAGIASFHINAQGNLTPCLMIDDVTYNLTKGEFLTGWQGVISSIRKMKISNAFDCKGCDKRVLCGFCPAFFKLENGMAEKCSNYLCTIGHLRYKRLCIQGGVNEH